MVQYVLQLSSRHFWAWQSESSVESPQTKHGASPSSLGGTSRACSCCGGCAAAELLLQVNDALEALTVAKQRASLASRQTRVL